MDKGASDKIKLSGNNEFNESDKYKGSQSPKVKERTAKPKLIGAQDHSMKHDAS